MAVVNTILNRSTTQTTQIIIGKLVFSGSYAAGGEPLDYRTISLATEDAPLASRIEGQSQVNNFAYDPVNKKVVIKTNAAPPVEITAGGYPASVTSDVITYEMTFKKA